MYFYCPTSVGGDFIIFCVDVELTPALSVLRTVDAWFGRSHPEAPTQYRETENKRPHKKTHKEQYLSGKLLQRNELPATFVIQCYMVSWRYLNCTDRQDIPPGVGTFARENSVIVRNGRGIGTVHFASSV